MPNPALRPSTFTGLAGTGDSVMTLGGTKAKIAILAILCAGTGYYSWDNVSPGVGFAGAIAGLVIALVLAFKPAFSPMLAPVYAIAEGALLGTVSRIFEAQYHGIVLQAILVTGAVFCATLAAYVTRIIRPTQRFVSIVVAATFGIMIFYLVSFVLGFFGIAPLAFGGPVSILISVVICIVAAANLIIDYGVIESGVEAGAPKYMEWYCAFGLLVTVVWLYFEILRLLAKLNRD